MGDDGLLKPFSTTSSGGFERPTHKLSPRVRHRLPAADLAVAASKAVPSQKCVPSREEGRPRPAASEVPRILPVLTSTDPVEDRMAKPARARQKAKSRRRDEVFGVAARHSASPERAVE
ncbi:hypothetical protein [Nonomuraea roseola]|uniref:hypothetical protein n=1 Tax=Nonomuraea roseola TaxID=46179 RepID=UPI0031F8CF6F